MSRTARSQVLGMAEELALVRDRRDGWRARYECAATGAPAAAFGCRRALVAAHTQIRSLYESLERARRPYLEELDKMRREFAKRDEKRDTELAAMGVAPETQTLVRAARMAASIDRVRADRAERLATALRAENQALHVALGCADTEREP